MNIRRMTAGTKKERSMIDLEDKNRWQDLAVQIIAEFKANRSEIQAKYGSLDAYALHREVNAFMGGSRNQ